MLALVSVGTVEGITAGGTLLIPGSLAGSKEKTVVGTRVSVKEF